MLKTPRRYFIISSHRVGKRICHEATYVYSVKKTIKLLTTYHSKKGAKSMTFMMRILVGTCVTHLYTKKKENPSMDLNLDDPTYHQSTN